MFRSRCVRRTTTFHGVRSLASETAWHTVTYTLAIVLFGRLSWTQSQICFPNCADYWKPPAAMMLAPSQDTILNHTLPSRASNW